MTEKSAEIRTEQSQYVNTFCDAFRCPDLEYIRINGAIPACKLSQQLRTDYCQTKGPHAVCHHLKQPKSLLDPCPSSTLLLRVCPLVPACIDTLAASANTSTTPLPCFALHSRYREARIRRATASPCTPNQQSLVDCCQCRLTSSYVTAFSPRDRSFCSVSLSSRRSHLRAEVVRHLSRSALGGYDDMTYRPDKA